MLDGKLSIIWVVLNVAFLQVNFSITLRAQKKHPCVHEINPTIRIIAVPWFRLFMGLPVQM